MLTLPRQVRELQLSVSQPLGFLLFEFIGAVSALGTAFYFSWRLTLVVIAVFPVAVMVLFLASTGIGPAIEAQKRELGKASKAANTSILAIDTVKVFNGQSEELWQYRVAIKKAATHYLVQARANAIQFGVTKLIMVGIFVQGFWYGIYLCTKGANPGDIVTAFYASLNAIQSIEVLIPQWLVLKRGMSAGKAFRSIRDQLGGQHKRPIEFELLKPFSCEGDVDVKSVSALMAP